MEPPHFNSLNSLEQDSLELAARTVINSDHVIALVGAGLSVESGIPTFRGPDGSSNGLGKTSMNGYNSFLSDPSAWWCHNLDQYADPERTKFRNAIDAAAPNLGHFALAKMEQMGILKHQITQNVDNLHFEAGSRSVSEIHGNRKKLRCVGCEQRWDRELFPNWIVLSKQKCSTKEFPPICPTCGGFVKTDTVMFGEPIPSEILLECFEKASQSDCILVIGTSATVYPAARFPQDISSSGGVIIEANRNETPLSKIATHILRGSTGITLPALVSRIEAIKKDLI